MSVWAQVITAAVAALGATAAVCMWVVRSIVREELRPMGETLAAQARDVAVLRVAVFNHLSHGKRPNEAQIREQLHGAGKA